jgi:hypothetical protein
MLAVDCLKSAEPGMIVNLLRALLGRLQDSDSALLFLYHDGIYCTLPLLIEPFDDSFPNLARAVFAIVDQVSQWMERQVIERCRRMGETFSKICLRMFGVYDLAAEPVKAELCNQMRSLGRLCSRVPVDESLSAWLKGNGFWPAAGSSIETAADGDDLLCQDTCSSGILEQDGADDDELLLQDPTWLHENF